MLVAPIFSPPAWLSVRSVSFSARLARKAPSSSARNAFGGIRARGANRPDVVVLSSGESHLFAANVSQEEQLRGVEKVELSPVNTVEPERRIFLKRPTIHISSRMNTCAIFTRISPTMNTYAISDLQAAQDEHLCNIGVGYPTNRAGLLHSIKNGYRVRGGISR
jgi:hypothetical protein